MMLRLHYEGFIQGSFYVRNIVVQKGPLTVPPEQRSKKTPSFRVIDFGRGEHFVDIFRNKPDEDRLERNRRQWSNTTFDEARRAQRELEVSEFSF